MTFDSDLQTATTYLNSQEAIRTLEKNVYWPKWNSPWWYMLLLHEMGATKQISAEVIKTFISTLNKTPLKIFPIYPADIPAGLDPDRDCPCHCQLATIYQVLTAWGTNVDKELPWIRPWLIGYQMEDGGMSCDNDAYLVKGECPSSMVGTIAVFEAILLCTKRPFTNTETEFLRKAANFLLERKLMLGSSSNYNAIEQKDEPKWLELCFPRFYFYDVLRGLSAVLKWSAMFKEPLTADAIQPAISFITRAFPDGNVKLGRASYAGVKTYLLSDRGERTWGHTSSIFPLLETVSKVGSLSPFLSQEWADAKEAIETL